MRIRLNQSRPGLAAKLGLLLAMVAMAALTGCSGGSSSPPPPAMATITGSLQSAAGGPIAGYTVTFDGSSSLQTTSDAQGQFSLVVPVSSVTGSDSITIRDLNGAIVDVIPVSPSGSSSSTVSVGTISLGTPPVPPPLVRRT